MKYCVDYERGAYVVADWHTGKPVLRQGFTDKREALVVAHALDYVAQARDHADALDTEIAESKERPRFRSVKVS